MQKTRIEVKVNIATYANACKVAQLTIDNWRDKTTDIADNDKKAKIDLTNVSLVEFGI